MLILPLLLCALVASPLPSDPVMGRATSRPLDLAGASSAQRELLGRYETEGTRRGEEFDWRLEKVGEGAKFVRYALSFESPVVTEHAANNTVHGHYWTPNQPGEHPAVVVLHWLAGDFEALNIVCQLFAQQGVCALMMYMPYYGPRRAGVDRRMISLDNEETLAGFRQAVLDIRRARDWLAERAEIADDQVGLLGISLGAVVGTLAAGVDTDFHRIVLLIGGGDLASIVMTPSPETRSIREEVARRGLGIDDLRAAWTSIEPLTFAARIDGKRVLMINADADEIIPKASSLKLRDALPGSQIEWFGGGHYDVVKKLLRIVPRAGRHLLGE